MRWSADTREQAADLFERGLGYKAVASQLGMSRQTVREWSYAWRALGREGLRTQGRRAYYDPELKLAVARARIDDGVSVVEVMERYGVNNRRQVRDWCLRYEKDGTAAFGLPDAPREAPDEL